MNTNGHRLGLGKLRKALPRGAAAVRTGDQVKVTIDGVVFSVDRKAQWEEKELASYLHSKVPPPVIKDFGK